MPTISVIIPVHNSEDFLPECIESILAQSFKDFEVLLMENFSTDNTYNVAKSYVEKDPRIKLFKLDVKGICNAQNEGLKVAAGDYIVIMDNDDIISRDHLEALYECITKGGEMGIAPFASYYKGGVIHPRNYDFKAGLYSGDSKAILLRERYVWARIYSRKLIEENNVRFEKALEHAEDWPFYVQMLLLSNTVVVTDKSCYYYRQGRQGQVTQTVSKERMEIFILALKHIEKLLKDNNVYEIYKPFYEYEFAKEIMGKTFGVTALKSLSPAEVGEVIEPIKADILRMNLDPNIAAPWLVKWFGYFKYWLNKGCYRRFFRFMRMYKNIVLQPLGIKIK